MSRKTIAAHIPCNCAGPQFENALRSAGWADNVVVHDASPGLAVSELARKVRPGVITVADDDPDLRARFLRHKDLTGDDFVAWVHADEDWSGPVAEEILEFLAGDSDAVGLDIFQDVVYFSEKFGLRGPYCRVMRRDKVRFAMESIHDMPTPEGKILRLRNSYLHFQDQNMLIFWVKNYKYCIVDALSGGAANPNPFDREGKLPLLAVLRYLLKINFHFLKGYLGSREKGLAGLMWAHNLMIRQIVAHLVPAEARRLVRLGQQYETGGHFEVPKLPAGGAGGRGGKA